MHNTATAPLPTAIDHGRNSPLREAFAGVVNTIVGAIDTHLPWVTPDMVTTASTLAHIVCATRASESNGAANIAWTAGAILTSAGDGIDGGLARKQASRGERELGVAGAIHDLVGDRVQEAADMYSVAARCAKNDDNVGRILFLAAGITATLPSIARARAEAHGVTVSELSFGTRPVRVALGTAALLAKDEKVATRIIGGYLTAANLATAAMRSRATRPGSRFAKGKIEDMSERQDSATRLRAVTKLAIGVGSVGVLQGVRLSRKK
jgi:phosphatidylglycerophosphate synthase